ncbi:MAG: hypothetical protein HQ581_04300 [Planctomycetes bacterium]|nr:hypothetical protein [Planctomycetota bacterium]
MPNDEPIVPMRLSKEVVSDLTDLIKNCDHVSNIVSAMDGVLPASSIRAFVSRLTQKVEADFAIVLDVVHTLVNIRRMQRERDVDPRRMIEILTASLERYAPDEWKKEYMELWQATADATTEAILSIGDDHALFVSGKAETLAYSHQNVLTSQRIITDIRPVFDTAGEKIKETLILHTLLVEYYDSISSPKRISFTLDSADVAALRKNCQRAEGKAVATEQALESLNPVQLPESFKDSK